jgi:ABC-2 type transport system ATP-binding protein
MDAPSQAGLVDPAQQARVGSPPGGRRRAARRARRAGGDNLAAPAAAGGPVADAIVTHDLTRAFRGRSGGVQVAVDRLNLRVAAGEIFGLLGLNGAGKTTTIRMLSTLLAPTSGRALVCGLDIRREAALARRRIGYVPQEKVVRHLLTGRESVEIETDLHHIPRAARGRRVAEVLDLVGLAAHADQFVAQYSGGMQKRLDLACGLLRQPDVLILDEPTLGLDVASRRQIWEQVRLLRDRGSTVLLATNYLDEADRLCDRIMILSAGRELVTGPPAAIKRQAAADVVRASTPAPERLRAALAPQPWARFTAATGPDEVSVHVDDGPRTIPLIFRAAQLCGAAVVRVSYQQPTLDDAFLLHTALATGAAATTA